MPKKSKPAPPSLLELTGRPILAIDLSLRSTGWASYSEEKNILWGAFEPTVKGIDRLRHIRDTVLNMASLNHLVVFEDFAGPGMSGSHAQRIGLAFLIRTALWEAGIPFVLVSPMTLKKFTFGSGKAEKSQMLKAVYKRWGHDCDVDDEADAVALLHLGLQLCGTESPTSAAQIECLGKVEVVQ